MTDKEIVNLVQSGDRMAYVHLVERHQRLVWYMISKLIHDKSDVEELAQDVFLKIFDKIEAFKFESKLSTWIATIAYRTAMNFAQKKKIPIDEGFDIDRLNNYIVDYKSPDKLTEKAEIKALVLEMVEQLPQQYQLVLSLFHLQEMSYPEIAEITGMPIGTVKNYLFRARKLLKDGFGELLKETIWD